MTKFDSICLALWRASEASSVTGVNVRSWDSVGGADKFYTERMVRATLKAAADMGGEAKVSDFVQEILGEEIPE